MREIMATETECPPTVISDEEKENKSPAKEIMGGGGEEASAESRSSEEQKDSAVSEISDSQRLSETADGIPKELLVKHPLQYKWVLWYCKQDKNKVWTECLKEVAAFETVEDFWALYNHIQLASGLSWGSDYYLFKSGIQPMWEDTQNRSGGRWLIQVDKNRRHDVLDFYWLELLMAMIGEQFDDFGEFVCGAVVNIRQKGDKISLWTKDSSRDDVNKRIGTITKQKLNIGEQITYELHTDTSHKSSSMVKARLRV